LYEWVINNVGDFKHKPKQREFARLNVTYTVMSKRYLRKLVETGLVDGWDDPRMPTICGLRRRGFTPSAIFEFVRRAGVAKAFSIVDVELLDHCIRDELNLKALRRVAVIDPIKLVITNYPEGKTEFFETKNNPNDESAGTRMLPFTRELYIDREDFAENPPPKFFRLKPGGEVRLMGAYIVRLDKIIKDEKGNPMLEWKFAESHVMWGMMFLFASGMALGGILIGTGAVEQLAALIAQAGPEGGIGTEALFVAFGCLLSELSSNTAAASVALPVVIGICGAVSLNPIPYLLTTVVAVNCAYVLPISTRAIPVAHGLSAGLQIRQGIRMAVLNVFAVTAIGWLCLKFVPMFSLLP